MGYYNIRLSKQHSNLCTNILQWVKYRYKCLPIGVINSPDIFLEKMNEMFCVFEFIQACIYDLFIMTKNDWSNHLEKLEPTLQNIKYNGLKSNIKSRSLDKQKWNI